MFGCFVFLPFSFFIFSFCKIQYQGDALKVLLFMFTDEIHQFAGSSPGLVLPHWEVKGRCCTSSTRSAHSLRVQDQLLQDRALQGQIPAALMLPPSFHQRRVQPSPTIFPVSTRHTGGPAGDMQAAPPEPGRGSSQKCSTGRFIYRYSAYSEETAKDLQRCQNLKR